MNTLRSELALAAALAVISSNALAAQLKPGDAFPALGDFQLEGRVPDLKGKVVLVDFCASWCGPCRASFPTMDDLHTRYAGKGLVILAVSVDEKRANFEAFVKRTPVQFAVVRDAQQKLVAAAHVETMPTSFLLDRKGNVRFVHSGFKGRETKQKYEQELASLLVPSAQ
ncbi:MAG TPA: TlpA disulfide reductase family protein [Verrucomicrobiae bacterium]|jgi:thiol-disulfide isomerase/thioredoxin